MPTPWGLRMMISTSTSENQAQGVRLQDHATYRDSCETRRDGGRGLQEGRGEERDIDIRLIPNAVGNLMIEDASDGMSLGFMDLGMAEEVVRVDILHGRVDILHASSLITSEGEA